jgi:Domain of unknown function (DUF4203)
MPILIGLIIGLLGLVICFFGLRFWFILLPILGAIVGFFVGAGVMQEIFGHGFLATGTSWVVGIVTAIAFAVLSYFIWYAGAIIAAGAVGASLFTGVLQAIISEPWGWVHFVVALVGALLFAIGALLLALPIYIVIVNTALGGALLAIGGVLVLMGTIAVEELSTGVSVAVVDEINAGMSWFWFVVWVVLSAAGIFVQLRFITEARLPEEKWVQAKAV